MFTNSNFLQLGSIILQEALLVTGAVMIVYLLIRGVLRGLEKASFAGKRRTTLVTQPTMSTTVEPECVLLPGGDSSSNAAA
jgi:hypothetical protein